MPRRGDDGGGVVLENDGRAGDMMAGEKIGSLIEGCLVGSAGEPDLSLMEGIRAPGISRDGLLFKL